MTNAPWTGNDDHHNEACHHRWLKERNRETGGPGYRETWYDEQCGGCNFWIALHGTLGADYGVCSNPDAPFDGRIRFEHDGCNAHVERPDSSFG